MNIYVAHSRQFNYQTDLYDPIRSSVICNRHNVVLPHENSGEPFDSKNFLKTCDLVIVEDSFPATGLGIELGWADMLGVPIFVVLRHNVKGTGSMKVLTKHIYRYETRDGMIRFIESKISEMED